MTFRHLIFASLWFIVVLRLAGAAATPDKMNRLLSSNPFGSGKSATVGTSTSGEAFEFRAVLEENGARFFSVYEVSTHRSNWVELNDPVNGFSVKGYDVAKESITVDYQGKTLTLAIKRAPAVAQMMPLPQQPVMGANGMPPSANAPVGLGGPTAMDQQRIQQIQEEIRRRRALRNQPAGPGNAPGAQPGFSNGPQPASANSTGPQPVPSNSTGPQPQPLSPKI